MAEEVCEYTSDKDKIIQLLRKEVGNAINYFSLPSFHAHALCYFMVIIIIIFFQIDSLKVKVAEMESQSGGGDRNLGLHQGDYNSLYYLCIRFFVCSL